MRRPFAEVTERTAAGCKPDSGAMQLGGQARRVARSATVERVRQASTGRCYRVHGLGRYLVAPWMRRP